MTYMTAITLWCILIFIGFVVTAVAFWYSMKDFKSEKTENKKVETTYPLAEEFWKVFGGN